MLLLTKNNKQIEISVLVPADLDALCEYLEELSPATKRRFGPHAFHRQAIIDFYQYSDKTTGYKAMDIVSEKIIAYAIIYKGILSHDRERLLNDGLVLNDKRDVTYAPSVADAFHGEGIGYHLLQYIIKQLCREKYNRMLLWGGVQKENEKAVAFYLRNGFKIIGSFNYNGENFDMALDLLPGQ